jgi:hypothetical protein
VHIHTAAKDAAGIAKDAAVQLKRHLLVTVANSGLE